MIVRTIFCLKIFNFNKLTLLYFYFTLSIRSDLNLRPSLICLLIVPVGLNKLLSAKIKGIFPVWIKGKKLFSEILQGRAIKEKMLNSFFYVATQGTSWWVICCYPAEMSIQLDMICAQAENCYLFFPFQEVYWIISVWFGDILEHHSSFVTLSPGFVPFCFRV